MRAGIPGHIKLRTNALRPALLVVAESWYPGWRATIDGQPVEVLRANYLSQGVVVPTGAHTVEMEYSPDSFRYGQMLSLVALLLLAPLAVWAIRSPAWPPANQQSSDGAISEAQPVDGPDERI